MQRFHLLFTMKTGNLVAYLVFFIACCVKFVVLFDICPRVSEGEELDLTAIAVTPRRVYMFTSNFYVFDLPTSLYDDTSSTLNLNSVNIKPMQVSEKWPNLVGHTYFSSLKMVWSSMYFIWDDEQDYFCISNRTRGIAYGIMDTQVRDFSNYFINARVAAVWSHNFLSGPFDNISGVNNDPSYNSTGIVWANFFKRENPPFGLNDKKFINPLCYGSSSHKEVYMYFTTTNKSDVCQGQPAWWLVTTGFVTSTWKIHMFGKDQKVYIFNHDIYVEESGPSPKVPLQIRSFDKFFKCFQNQNQSSDATEVVSSLSTEQHNRSTLIIAITVAAIICLCVWLSLCIISLQDCHKQSSPQSSHPLRRPTVVRNLDSEAD